MTPLRTLGLAMLAAFFAALFRVTASGGVGWRGAACVWGIALAATAFVTLAVLLAMGEVVVA